MKATIIRESTSSSLHKSRFTRGDSETIIVRITGQSLVITNFGFTFTAKSSSEDADEDAVILKTSASGEGIIVTLPAPNQLEAVIAIDPEDTEILANKSILYYDIQMSTVSPRSNRTLELGYFTIIGDITRDNTSPPAPAPVTP